MAITTLDGIVAAYASGQTMVVNKASIATQGTAGFTSLWRATGTPGQGAIPSTAAICDDTLTGAWLFTDPVTGSMSYFARGMLNSSNSGTTIYVYDRLAHMGGLSGTTTTAQVVGVGVSGSTSNMNNRRGASDYSDVEWWLEIYTDIGTTGATATISYENASGSPGSTTLTIGGTSPLNQDSRIFPITGNNGEKIRAIGNIIHATTGTAGSYGITATRRLATIGAPLANYPNERDWAQLGFPRVHDQACLFFILMTGTTSSGTLVGDLKLVQG